jgi:hypothetical protein
MVKRKGHIPVGILFKHETGMYPSEILFESAYFNFTKLGMIVFFPGNKSIFKQQVFIKKY